MKKTLLMLSALIACTVGAAPAPYPLTVNSRAATAPNALVFRASESLFRVSFVDGSTASSVSA
jgi:hypothetical protein